MSIQYIEGYFPVRLFTLTQRSGGNEAPYLQTELMPMVAQQPELLLRIYPTDRSASRCSALQVLFTLELEDNYH